MAPRKMAQKRAPLANLPLASSSSEEDEQATDKQEENQNQDPPKETAKSESSEEEENKPSAQKPTPAKTLHPQSSDSDSGSDSETHLGHTQPSPIKPMDVISPQPKKPTPAAKRPMPELEKNVNESRKKKKAKVVEEQKKQKSNVGPMINRLWSEDDEVMILTRLIDFRSKKGAADPSPNMGEFYELIKKSLSVTVSKSQFVHKICKLRAKYINKVKKWDTAIFSHPHEQNCFELSKKIWGGGGDGRKEDNASDGKRKNVSKRGGKTVKQFDYSVALPEESGEEVALEEGLKGEEMKGVKVDKVEDFWAMHPFLKQSLETKIEPEPVIKFMMENICMIGNEKAEELEKKWNDLRVDEVALYLKRVELIQKQTKLVLDAKNASKD